MKELKQEKLKCKTKQNNSNPHSVLFTENS